MKCKRNSDGRALDHQVLEAMRKKAVQAVREGQPAGSVAAAFGVNVRSVYRWLAEFGAGGERALRAKPIVGRPPKVNAEQRHWLAQALTDSTPQQHGMEFGLWTLSLIGELLRRQYGVKLSVAGLARLMKQLGFTPQKPLYQAWQQDPEKVREWETRTWPAIRDEARALGATVYFADESGIRSDYHSGTTWAPCGRTPVVGATGRRFSLNMISAVSTQGLLRFMLHDGSVTAPVFLDFLKRLMIGAEKPVFVVLDGHPIHKAKIVTDYVAKQDGKLRLFDLPSYSPHLNPDEQVWAHVKREVSARVPQDKDQLKKMVVRALRRIQKLPELLKSFFRQPECLLYSSL